MSKILRIIGTTKKYGGDLYEDELAAALRSEHSVADFSPVESGLGKVQQMTHYVRNLQKIQKIGLDYDYVFRPMNHTFLIPPTPKQVVIGYHYDTAFCRPLVKIHHNLGLRTMIRAQKNIHKLIVIAQYWRDFYAGLGFKSIELLYCGFNPSEFHIAETEVEAFKDQHGLQGKKVVYIGNAQRKKGADLVYEALKDSDYFLVTSGNKDIDLPVLNLNLKHRDYLCLLKAAGLVVTYSQFKEGWNRVAHEAMLLKTPVIGSGAGGMGELLKGGGQGICTTPYDLKKEVDRRFGNADLGAQGYEYAKEFTMERFKTKALEIFSS